MSKIFIRICICKPFYMTFVYVPPAMACSFKGIGRQADISLADFWGVQEILPEMLDDKGTSLVLIHSTKGQALFDAVKKNMVY